jgi:hypothetical protein
MSIDLQTVIYKIKSLLPGNYRKVSSIETQIKNISESVGIIIQGVEDDFLILGNGLQTIYNDTETLTVLTKETSEIAGSSSDSSNLVNISKFSKGMLDKLNNYQNQIAESLQNLNTAQSELGGLSDLCENNEKLVTLLNIIALNIAIECNRSEKAKEMFLAFVQEVKQLSDKIGKVTKDMGKDINSAISDQIKSQDIISKKLNDLLSLSSSVENIVGSTSEKIEHLIASSLGSLEKAGLYSSEISMQVGKIVIAIQFHDIVRQKIEHVVSALDEALVLLKGKRVTRDSYGRVFTIIKLQNAQIRVVLGEIDNAYLEIRSGFDGIEKKVVQLVECINDSSSMDNKKDEDNPFSNIVSGIGTLDNLILDAKKLNGQMGDIAKEASGSARELKKYVSLVQNISLDLHRKALNAIIKSAHLGETGRTLEIFAKEVTNTSQTSDEFANQVIEIVTSISDIADNLERVSQSDTGNENQTNLEIDAIVKAYDTFNKNTEAAVDKSNSIQSLIEKIKNGLSFMPQMSEKILAIVEEFDSICDIISNHTGIKEEMKEVVESTSQRYTMLSERLVHNDLLGEPEEVVEKTDEEDTPEKDEDDLGDNIDLF